MKSYKGGIWFILGLLIGCHVQKTSKYMPPEKLANKIENKLGSKAQKATNFNDTHVLAWTEDYTSGTLVLRFGVWLIASGDLVYADSAIRGSVKWLDNTSLLVVDYPGIVDEEQSIFTFKIDLTTKIKTPINEQEEL